MIVCSLVELVFTEKGGRRLWGKMEPPITIELNAHISTKSSPFALLSPSPCLSITCSLPSKALMEWEPIKARLIVARFYGTLLTFQLSKARDYDLSSPHFLLSKDMHQQMTHSPKKKQNSMIPYRAPSIKYQRKI